jgi:uncharacterized membrane protein YfcA
VRLVVIGMAAGLFSGVFGVGGGLIVVPLLVLWAGWDQRRAAGTSLATIGITAAAGAALYAMHGEVKPGAALLVGLPAAAGALAGASLQQRLANRTLSLAFAALVAAIAVRLLVP